MRSTPRVVVTLAASLSFCSCFLGGCLFPQGNASDGGTTAPWSSNMVEITVNGAHFGPAAGSGSASLVNTRDASGNVTAGHFTMTASVGGATCNLGFDRFGDSAAIGVGQYTVRANVGSSTPSGVVYPTSGEEVLLPAANGGSAHCSGDACDSAAFVISTADSAHVYGYWMGAVQSDQGLGDASVVCTFYLPWSQYQP